MFLQHVRTNAPTFHRAYFEVFYDYVGRFQHPHQNCAAFILRQIQRDTAFVAVKTGEVAAKAVGKWRTPLARLVALRWFDLDHICAVVGQHLRTIRATQHPRQVDHFHAFKRTVHIETPNVSRANFG